MSTIGDVRFVSSLMVARVAVSEAGVSAIRGEGSTATYTQARGYWVSGSTAEGRGSATHGLYIIVNTKGLHTEGRLGDRDKYRSVNSGACLSTV